MKTLLSLFLYLALLNSVASLTCFHCMQLGKECKHPVAKVCDSDEQACMSAVAQGSLGAFKMSVSFMSCIQPQYCRPGDYGTSIGTNLHSHFKVACCQTDKCNNVSITIPENEDHTQNGLQCPSCYALHSDHCKARDTVNCIQNEDHCFYYGVILHNGTRTEKMAVQGCATGDACAFKKGSVDADNHNLKINFTHEECYPAKPHSSREL